jgi:hypothetical protein
LNCQPQHAADLTESPLGGSQAPRADERQHLAKRDQSAIAGRFRNNHLRRVAGDPLDSFQQCLFLEVFATKWALPRVKDGAAADHDGSGQATHLS